MAKVLVTGASGFIGTHQVAALAARAAGYVPCAKDLESRPLAGTGGALVFGDVTNPDSLPAAVAGRQVVYHLAGCTLVLKNRQFYEVNHRGAAHIAKARGAGDAAGADPFSSLAAAGPVIEGRPRVESDPPARIALRRSKRSGEHAAESFAHCVPVPSSDLRLCWARATEWASPCFVP